jgi:hypothetical protein
MMILGLASNAEAELPIRQGGAAAPPTAGREPLVLLCSSSPPASCDGVWRRAVEPGSQKRVLWERKGKLGLDEG